ncbi:MAG: helicase C-terminal domain-containing protein [Promethearchaeota archaeon]
MKFCPDCQNLLYPMKKGLYCKFCHNFFNNKDGNLKEEVKSITINKSKLNMNDLSSEIKGKKKNNIKLPKNMNYLHFFPYEQFRESQENIIKEIEINARSKKIVLLVAPNGTGKTIIALSSLLPLAIENDLKIVYLCRTHSQNTRVIKELIKISNFINLNEIKGAKINGLSIRGRNEMCLNKTLLSLKLNPRESMAVCRDLRKNRNCTYFLNLLKKRDEFDKPVLIAPKLFENPIDAEDLINFCNNNKICPYFLSKFLLEEMRVIICNYNWIFNPFIRESFLKFIGREIDKCILVIDECHNIIDVATDVNSERITPYSLRICLKDLEMYQSPVLMQSFVNILYDHLNKKKEVLKIEEKAIVPDILLEKMYKKLGLADLNEFENFIKDLHEFSIAIHEEKLANGEISRDFVGALAEFWLKWIKVYSLENYFFCYNIQKLKEKANIAIEIVALDPREIAIPILKNCYSCLNLSGTVNPYVFNNLMGLHESGKGFKGIIADSPFKKQNIKAIITEGVDTKRESRNTHMYKKMINKINEVLYCTPANVGIFCASYKILKGLLENDLEITVQKNNKKLFVEEPGLSASENAFLVNDFKSMASNHENGAVLLGVCGGRNSEGEDYPGDFMNSVIIAGFPYHLPTPRVNAKIEYYDRVFNKQGWNFAYLYPAVQRANQASGRPIRKIVDKGAIIFMDSRFKDKHKWISEWIRKELEIVPDKQNAIIQHLYPFWNSS